MKIEVTSMPNQYDDFIKKNSCTFYQSTKHLRLLEQILQLDAEFITVEDNGELIGVMPFFSKNTKFGRVINSLPFFGSYGGIISKKIEVKKNILNFFNKYNKENDILSSVIISNPFEPLEIYEKYYEFNNKDERRIQCVNIDSVTKNQLWTKFEQRVRRSIRKAEKNLVTIEYSNLNEELLNDFYNHHVSNIISKNGTTKPKEFLSLLKENFVIGEDYDILMAKYENKPISYLLVFYFKTFVEYYMPAYDVEKSNLQGTSLLIWESMKKAIANNMEYYNFGGTHMDQNSLYNFKKGWGTDDFHYYYYIHSDLNKLKEIEMESLKTKFKNFYVYNYDKLFN